MVVADKEDVAARIEAAVAKETAALREKVAKLEAGQSKFAKMRPGGPRPGDLYPSKHKSMASGAHGFEIGDVVRLSPESPKFSRTLAYLEKSARTNDDKMVLASMKAEEGPLGEVWSFLYASKDTGEQKYKVKFPIIGQDGCLESELILVRRP